MVWYLRKSVKLGPIRFNLSKIGIGTSVGVKGFRVKVSPNGKSYIHASRNGLYYHQELRWDRNRVESKINLQHTNEIRKPLGTKEYNTASSQELIPQSRKELLDKLNESYKETRLDYLCGIIFLLISFFCFSQGNVLRLLNVLGSLFLVLGAITTFFVARWESKRRTIVINYDFENNSTENFKKIISAFNNLASNRKVWSLINSKNIYATHQSKLNAGAGNLINRTISQIGEGKPPWVETNIDVPVMITRGQSLYMMPDGILVYDNKGVGFVEYRDVTIKSETTRFIEARPPDDARIVDETWQYPNKNGEPDRRFKNNYKIPICLYGKLEIQSNSGMYFYLMTSKHDSPLNFSSQFSGILK